MADKSLTESAWKAFAKKKSLKDSAFVAALSKFEAAGKLAPEQQIELLEAFEKQSAALRKAYKDDKELGKYLDDVDKALDKEGKTLAADAKKAKEAAAAAAAAEEDDSPAKLTGGLVPLLRDVAKGKPMHARIAVAGKAVAVLLSRKEITVTANKMLNEYLKVTSGAKYFPADCIFEANKHTFVVEKRPGNFAKVVQKALLDQTGIRWKVRVRGSDPADVEEGEDDDERGDAAASGSDAPASVAAPAPPEKTDEPAPAQASPPESASEDKPVPQDDPLRQAYEKKLAELEPRLAEALKRQQGDVGKLRALSAFASGKAEADDFKAAAQALVALEALLPPEGGTAPAGPGDGGDPMAAFKTRLNGLLPQLKGAIDAGKPGAEGQRALVTQAGALANKKDYAGAAALLDGVERWLKDSAGSAGKDGLVALQKSRLAWDGFRKSIQVQLKELETDLMAAVKKNNDDPDANEDFDPGEVAAGVVRLHKHLDTLDDSLIVELDKALNTAGEERMAHQSNARELVAKYQSFVDTDATIAKIDTNGFTAITIRRDAQKTLADLAAQL